MWTFRTRKHCDDQCLIGYLDGEISLRQRWLAKCHLMRCWQCRTRLNELERQVRRLSAAYRSDVFPSPGRVDAARRRFFAEARALGLRRAAGRPDAETPLDQAAGFRPPVFAPRPLALPLLLVLIVAAAASAVFLWLQREDPARRAEAALASVRSFEESLQRSPQVVRQTFLVEIVERKPAPERLHGRLEILSDARRSRFASRWSTLDGSLRHGLWKQPESGPFLYQAGRGVVPAPPEQAASNRVSLLQIVQAGESAEALERGFVRWLETRDWRPLSLASDFAVFADNEGSELRAERVTGPDGGERIRLTALRRGPEGTIEIVLELDSRTHSPRMKRIRYDSGARSLELIFVARPVEFIPPRLVKASLFRPPRRLLAAAPRESDAARPSGVGRPSRQPSLQELADLEAEALFTLHRLNVCRGEQVEVVRDARRVLVHGVVDEPERKQEILAALDRLSARRWLAAEISTVGEAALPGPPGNAADYSAAVTEQIRNRIPIHDELLKYFEQRRNPSRPAAAGAEPARRVELFAAQANARWDAVWTEAFALRRLAERYPEDGRLALLSPQTRWLVETIVQDHFRALHQKAGAALAQIEPVFRSIAGVPPADVAEPADLSAAFAGAPGPGWQRRVFELFRQVTQCHETVRRLLTVGSERRGEIRTDTAPGRRAVNEMITALLDRAARLAEGSASLTTAAREGTPSSPPNGPP